MVVMLHTKNLFRLIEETEAVPSLDNDKETYWNRLDEAHGHFLSSVSRDIRFQIQGLNTPKAVWDKLSSLFDKKDEMRVHQLENELISLHPSNFGTLNEFFTKFKNLRFQLKLCKVEKEDDQLILAILSTIGADYSVFVSTFHYVKIYTPKWKIPTLKSFIESLT